MRIKLVSLIIGVLFIILAVPVKAAEKKGLTIDPAFIEIDISKAEREKTFNLNVTNNDNTTLSIELFALNFRHKDEIGTVQFLGEDSRSYLFSLASYISLPTDSIRLKPHEKRTIIVTVQNRQDLSPGGHYAGIIARIVPDSESKTKTNIRPSVTSLILLKKRGGEQYNLSLKEVNWPSRFIHFGYPNKIGLTFQNEGNIHLIPRGVIEIRDITGRLIYKGVINSSSLYVLPSSKRFISISVNKISISLPISINTVYIKGNDSLKKTTFTYRNTYIYLHPIILSIFLLALVITLKYSIRKWVKK